jgi:hypothetical protein
LKDADKLGTDGLGKFQVFMVNLVFSVLLGMGGFFGYMESE